jgi:hypothetical protein
MNERDHIYKLIGEMVWLSQLIEFDLKILSLCVTQSEINNDSALNSEVKKHSRKTLGQLIKYFKNNNTLFQLNQNHLDTLTDCLNSRNFITHNLFDPEPPDIQSSSGRKKLIIDLKDNLQKMNSGFNLISGMKDDIAIALGLNVEQIKQKELNIFEKDS